MPESRIDRVIRLIGGVQNLQPKPPPPEEPAPPPTPEPDDIYQTEVYKNLPPPRYAAPPWAAEGPPKRQPNPPQLVTRNPAFVYDGNGGTKFTFGKEKGRSAPLGINFCPFSAITRYCYKFAPKGWLQPLATVFFDQDKIYTRDWELYYIHSDYSGLVTFIPESQLQKLLDDINNHFPDAKLTIPDWAFDEGLVIDFEDLPQQYRPRYVGQLVSREQFASWTFQLDQEPQMYLQNSRPVGGDRSLDAFKAKMDAAADTNKKKNKATRAKKHQEVVMKRQDMVRQSLRGQRYLGLHPKNDDESLLPDISALSVAAIDPTLPAPHPFEQEPIFISIDCEAWEKPPRMVTEVGVITLDTRDLQGVAPGPNGAGWHKFIRGRHFRIIEYKHCINYEYVQGCPDAFEFGDSEFVGKDNLCSVLSSCFREPFSQPPSKHDEDFPPLGSPLTTLPSSSAIPEPRNIILVGHDLKQDIEYCRSIGFSMLNLGNIIDTMDTVNMYRTFAKDPNSRSLGSILAELDLTGWHLHNAGNDAAYTLHAMLAMCVKAASGRGSAEVEGKIEEKREKRVETTVEVAKEKAREDAEGWDAPVGEDGGVAAAPTGADYAPQLKPKKNGVPRHGLYTVNGAVLDV